MSGYDPLIDRLTGVAGPRAVLADPADMAPYLRDQRGLYESRAICVLRPASTEETAELVAICAETRTPVVPQGGNTGLVGGSVPDDSGSAVVLNLGRMNRIRDLDPIDNTMTVEAGCILADLQAAAKDANRLFPLSLGAEGSCMIGGNLSTNAGGVQVLKYGNARDLVLGLEVVLPDGRIWNGLGTLRKDNTGYDLKQVFIGAEGTLGIITAASLKLFPRPGAVETALLAVPELDAVTTLLSDARAASGDCVTGFELIPRLGLEFVARHFEDLRAPIETVTPWYVLMEWSAGAASGGDAGSTGALRDTMEAFLAERFEDGALSDAVLASSEAQANELWHIREILPEAQTREGGSIKQDVSVAVSRVPAFIKEGTRMVEDALSGVRLFPFGHVGDGNIHFNVSQPVGMDKAEFLSHWEEINRLIHDLTMKMGGSFSAEHGIGRLKRAELARYAGPVELDLMRRIKDAFDPDGIMNPGKVL